MCFFRNRQNEFTEYFSQENELVFSNDAFFVTEALGHQNDSTECRLFCLLFQNLALKMCFYTTDINPPPYPQPMLLT